jgi:hypothetical protein
MDQRNKRFEKDLQETHDLSTTQTASSLSRPQEVAIAERVRSNVKTYLETEEKKKKLAGVLRKIRKQSKELQDQIIKDMSILEVENLDLKKGKLVAKKTTPKVPLTKASITSILTKNLGSGSEELITRIVTLLYEARDRSEKISLAHYENKRT